MNVAELHRKVIAAARAFAPSDRVPYAFEKRVMALVLRPADALSFWSTALWRAALSCVAAVALVGGISFFTTQTTTADLTQDFESTLLAGVDQIEEVW